MFSVVRMLFVKEINNDVSVMKIKRYNICFLTHATGMDVDLCGLGHTQIWQRVKYVWELTPWITKKNLNH